MNRNEIIEKVDHTLLKQTATWEDMKEILNEAIKYKTASACIPPSFVKQAKEYVGNKLKICTVIGFPNGYNTTKVKAFETKEALQNGADEIDMVINIGKLKEKDFEYIKKEIETIKKECNNKVLKVIIETCLLKEDEKIKMCEILNEIGNVYIKTSTGFSTSGATIEDIKIFVKHIDKNKVKIKAAGGMSSFEDAEEFINLGVDRLGTSKLIKIAKEG